MDIIKVCSRDLTEGEKESIEHFKYYGDSTLPFVLASENVAVFFKRDEIDGLSDDEITDTAIDKMRELMSCHPDFNPLVMDDGYGLVSMIGEIYGITDKLTDEEIEDGVSFGKALVTRAEIMSACEDEEILVIVK